jgi:hypothetical protein
MESLVAADRWRTAFRDIATLCGFSAGASREPDTQSVQEAVQRTRASEQALQVVCREIWYEFKIIPSARTT